MYALPLVTFSGSTNSNLDIMNNDIPSFSGTKKVQDWTAEQEAASRRGSLALMSYATVQFLTTFLAPIIIPKTRWDGPKFTNRQSRISKIHAILFHSPWTALCSLWILGHAIFAASMFSTFFVTTTKGATILAGVVGISAGMTQFVPFALISMVLAKYNNKDMSVESRGLMESEKAMGSSKYQTQPGIVMGLHNTAIAAPQLIAAVGSSAIFGLFGRGDNEEDKYESAKKDVTSTGWVLRVGGVTALVAIYMISKLKEELDEEPVFDLSDVTEEEEDGEDEEKGLGVPLMHEVRAIRASGEEMRDPETFVISRESVSVEGGGMDL